MTKRFTIFGEWHNSLIVDEIRDNGRPMTVEDIVDYLNSYREYILRLQEQNQQIRQTIREAYENERTQIGRNVLKQLLEAIQ